MTKEQRQHNGAKTVCSTNDAGTTGHPHAKKKESRHRPYTLYKINLKWITDPNTRHKTMKCLEHNTGENLGDLGMAMTFQIPNAWSIKEIIWVGLYKIENFRSAKDIIKRIKTVHRLGENMCKRHIW